MNRIQAHVLGLAAVIFFVLSAFDLFGAIGSADALNWPDPILPLSNRWVLVLCGVAELAVSAILLLAKSKWVRLGWLAWFTTNLLVYRIGLWLVGASAFGDCLGNYVDWVLISPRTMGMVTNASLGLMLAGSYTFLIWNWLRERKRRARKSVKPAVPAISPQPAS